MNSLKPTPKGLDVTIQTVQVLLYEKLTNLWGVEINGNGRCYVTHRDGRKTIEKYIDQNEYQNLLVAEENKFFFTAENEVQKVGYNTYKTRIDLYFIVNITDLKPLVTEYRADEDVRVDVLNVLSESAFVDINRVIVGVENVFNRYEYEITDDMQPYHVFKIELDTVEYNINQNYCIN